MNVVELEAFLQVVMVDRKVSGSEKEALAAWLAANVKSEQDRGVARHTAIQVARTSVSDPDSNYVIDCLDDILKIIVPVQLPNHAPTSPGHAPERAYFAPGDACMNHLVSRFKSVRTSADVCVFTITYDRISNAILDAHQRGVKVRIISDRQKATDQGSDILTFENAGIPVKLDDVHQSTAGNHNGHMHHKFALFDGTRLVNGSYNWTRGAAEMNYENLVETDDPGLVAAFAAEFERLWKRF
jgi:phosphatidylserine/phosphatidylglycerophosphate/cardiolipin synthase-like enzyme